MKLKRYLSEQKTFRNWVNYTPESLDSDFAEYKKKESGRWKRRAQSMGFRFPIFKDYPDFVSSLKKAKVKKLFRGEAEKISNVALNDTIEDVEDMVSDYRRPRDVQRIVQGFSSNEKMPMPIILKGKNGMHIMAGNTRLNVAYILGILPEVLIIDVSEKK